MDTIENEPTQKLADESARLRSFQDAHEAEALGGRIKAARGALSQKQLADLVGVHFNTIGKLEKGHSPDAKTLLAVAKATDVSAAWLLLGEPHSMRGYVPPTTDMPVADHDAPKASLEGAAVVERKVTAVEAGSYIYVPHFDIQASAGPGFFNDVENVIAMRPFERGYIRSKLGISHNELALINIVGRSMEPLLHSGDVSMIDRRDREGSVEGVHVIRVDGALMVKSIQRRPGRVLRVSSRNLDYDAFELVPDEDNQRDFEILGRLRWAGITLH